MISFEYIIFRKTQNWMKSPDISNHWLYPGEGIHFLNIIPTQSPLFQSIGEQIVWQSIFCPNHALEIHTSRSHRVRSGSPLHTKRWQPWHIGTCSSLSSPVYSFCVRLSESTDTFAHTVVHMMEFGGDRRNYRPSVEMYGTNRDPCRIEAKCRTFSGHSYTHIRTNTCVLHTGHIDRGAPEHVNQCRLAAVTRSIYSRIVI